MIRFSSNRRFIPFSALAEVAGLLGTCFTAQTRWLIAFVAACVGLVAAVVFLIRAASGFVDLRSIGLSGSVLAGLTIGIVVSAGLGAGLMALVFQSDRDGQDEAVYRASGTAAPPSVSRHRRPPRGSRHSSRASPPDLQPAWRGASGSFCLRSTPSQSVTVPNVCPALATAGPGGTLLEGMGRAGWVGIRGWFVHQEVLLGRRAFASSIGALFDD